MDERPPDAGPPATWLVELIGEFLAIEDEELPVDQPLGELGIDSLTAAELSKEVEERAGVYVAMERFLGEETLADVAAALGSQRPVGERGST